MAEPKDLIREAAAAIRQAEKELSKAGYEYPVREEGSPGMCAGCSTPITIYGPETKKGNGKWVMRCPECSAKRKKADREFPDYADVIHTEPRTWGQDHPAPTRRPWHLSKGVGDDDHSGSYHEDGRPRTNKEFEEFLEEARANGQVVHLRTQEGKQRAPGNDSWANSFNRKIRKEEQDRYKSHSPNGCPCIYCKAKKENAAERKRQRQAR